MRQKPAKPSPDYPLGPASNGQWCKKVKGKLEYFGTWDDPDRALAVYQHWLATGSKDLSVPSPGSKAKAARPAKGAPPRKPSRDFPLYAHTNGQWAKKVRQETITFGPWDDPQAALAKWNREKDSLLAGRKPRTEVEGITVLALVNSYLSHKETLRDNGELKARTYADYKKACDRIVAVFGKQRLVSDLGPEDFQKLRKDFAKTHDLVALSIDINRSRMVFNYADETFQIRVRYGQHFDKPSKGNLRKLRNEKPKKFFYGADIRALTKAAPPHLKAMILLGINCGFGNDDCANLETTHLDLDGGWHNFPRPKTGITRRAPLWPETVTALRAALTARPKPRDPAHVKRVFITAKGNSWARVGEDNPVSKEMAKLLKGEGLHQAGRGFYSLRHTFQTVGDGSGQEVAVKYVMGHAPASDDMAARYRELTFEKNILIASNYVRDWMLTDNNSSRLDTLPEPAGEKSSGRRRRGPAGKSGKPRRTRDIEAVQSAS